MKRKKYVGIVATAMGFILPVAGCGVGKLSPQNTQPSAGVVQGARNPPFYNELNLEVGAPDPQFDPQLIHAATYDNLTVYSANGRVVHLNTTNQPILFIAYWCPHCQRTLVLLRKHRNQLKSLPVVVSMGFAPGTTLEEAVHIGRAEERALGLQNYQIFYDVQPNSGALVPNGFPTFVFPDHGQVDVLFGEHTWRVWEQALKVSEAT